MTSVQKLREFLEQTRSDPSESARQNAASSFPQDIKYALTQLPLERLTKQPLFDLLNGFEVDLRFGTTCDGKTPAWPIQHISHLLDYGYAVAGTVAELCLDIAFHYYGAALLEGDKKRLKHAGSNMGKALQTVNIARDIQVDAKIGRVYIPCDWLEAEGLTPEDVIKNPTAPVIGKLRLRLLDTAFDLYRNARPEIEYLPVEVRAPMRVAVESYMEIGRVLRSEGYIVHPGKATVPRWRRLVTAFRALNA